MAVGLVSGNPALVTLTAPQDVWLGWGLVLFMLLTPAFLSYDLLLHYWRSHYIFDADTIRFIDYGYRGRQEWRVPIEAVLAVDYAQDRHGSYRLTLALRDGTERQLVCTQSMQRILSQVLRGPS